MHSEHGREKRILTDTHYINFKVYEFLKCTIFKVYDFQSLRNSKFTIFKKFRNNLHINLFLKNNV
jgi:hypothetical protein